jgi:hypothetical protein
MYEKKKCRRGSESSILTCTRRINALTHFRPQLQNFRGWLFVRTRVPHVVILVGSGKRRHRMRRHVARGKNDNSHDEFVIRVSLTPDPVRELTFFRSQCY